LLAVGQQRPWRTRHENTGNVAGLLDFSNVLPISQTGRGGPTLHLHSWGLLTGSDAEWLCVGEATRRMFTGI
jgi:hypothetical protein